jgi:hypothetical protein
VGGVRILLDILTMHVPINVKSPNNISKWQVGFNSAFKGLNPSAFVGPSNNFTPLLCNLNAISSQKPHFCYVDEYE